MPADVVQFGSVHVQVELAMPGTAEAAGRAIAISRGCSPKRVDDFDPGSPPIATAWSMALLDGVMEADTENPYDAAEARHARG